MQPDRRENNQQIIDMLTDIKIDTAVLVEKVTQLEAVDAGERLTKIESRNRAVSVIGGVLLALVATQEYLSKLLFG